MLQAKSRGHHTVRCVTDWIGLDWIGLDSMADEREVWAFVPLPAGCSRHSHRWMRSTAIVYNSLCAMSVVRANDDARKGESTCSRSSETVQKVSSNRLCRRRKSWRAAAAGWHTSTHIHKDTQSSREYRLNLDARLWLQSSQSASQSPVRYI